MYVQDAATHQLVNLDIAMFASVYQAVEVQAVQDPASLDHSSKKR